jgi:hypothetical protein
LGDVEPEREGGGGGEQVGTLVFDDGVVRHGVERLFRSGVEEPEGDMSFENGGGAGNEAGSVEAPPFGESVKPLPEEGDRFT